MEDGSHHFEFNLHILCFVYSAVWSKKLFKRAHTILNYRLFQLVYEFLLESSKLKGHFSFNMHLITIGKRRDLSSDLCGYVDNLCRKIQKDLRKFLCFQPENTLSHISSTGRFEWLIDRTIGPNGDLRARLSLVLNRFLSRFFFLRMTELDILA